VISVCCGVANTSPARRGSAADTIYCRGSPVLHHPTPAVNGRRLSDFAHVWQLEDDPAERRRLLGILFNRVWQDGGMIVAVKPREAFLRYFQTADELARRREKKRGVKSGSDGTRTRDLRRDRPVRGSRPLTTIDAESLYSCGFWSFRRFDSAWLSEASFRRLLPVCCPGETRRSSLIAIAGRGVTVPGTPFTVPVKISTSWKLALPSVWMIRMPWSVEVPLNVPV